MDDWHAELFVQAELDLSGLDFAQAAGRIIHIVFVIQNVGAKTERQNVQGHICHDAQFFTLVDWLGVVRSLKDAAIEVSMEVERVGRPNGGYQESAHKGNANRIHGILYRDGDGSPRGGGCWSEREKKTQNEIDE